MQIIGIGISYKKINIGRSLDVTAHALQRDSVSSLWSAKLKSNQRPTELMNFRSHDTQQFSIEADG